MGWQGPLVMGGFVGIHLACLPAERRNDGLMLLASAAVGLTLDHLLAVGGWVTYVGRVRVGLIPLWLVMIWAGFGVTLRHSQSIFIRSKRAALSLGAVCGPAAYWGGVKLERMTVHGETAWLAIGALWMLALVLLHAFRVRWVDEDAMGSCVPRAQGGHDAS